MSSTHPARLTIRRIMLALAGLALAFAFLPLALSVVLAVTVTGVLALDGMRIPLVASSDSIPRWVPWLIWSLALLACPATIAVVAALNPHTEPAWWSPRPWAAEVLDRVLYAHLGVSGFASVAVFRYARGAYRWLAWAAILIFGAFALMLHLGA